MMALGIMLAIAFFLRLPYQSATEATLASAMLIPFMLIAFRFGGWTSWGSALRWSQEHKLVGALEAIVVLALLILAITGGKHPIIFAAAEAISAYFFLHAFGALGEWLRLRFGKGI